MTKKAEPGATDVYRLTDIVVEEVSLVDRAANEHQFLIVKRSDMGQSKEKDEEGKTGAGSSKTAKADAATMRTAAVGALDTLTQAVEQLGADGELAPEALAEVVGELRDVIQQLAGVTGDDTSKAGDKSKGKKDGQDGAADEGDDDDEEQKAKKQREATDSLKAVHELLGKIAGQLKAGGATDSSATNDKSKESGGEAVAKALAGIADALKEQGQRLAKLEKQHGLPNSRPSSERNGGGADDDDDDSSWPLDMNRPMDRESVDKSVSFHGRGGAR